MKYVVYLSDTLHHYNIQHFKAYKLSQLPAFPQLDKTGNPGHTVFYLQ